MAVEAGADERAVVVPSVAGVGRGVNGEQGERAVTHPAEDRIALPGAPRCLADGEQHERARFTHGVHVDQAHVVDALGIEALQLSHLLDTHRGLLEHPVHARRSVTVRRDLADEQEAIGHTRNVARSRRRFTRGPRPARTDPERDRLGYAPGPIGTGRASRPRGGGSSSCSTA